jgi:uncharacterized protein YoxC
MELWVQIASVVALLSFSALCWYALAVLSDVRKTLGLTRSLQESLQNLPREMQDLRGHIAGTLENVEDASRYTASITQKINEDMRSSVGIFGEIEALSRQIRQMREYLQIGILQPLGKIAVTVRALSKASETFMESLRRSEKK